MYFRILWILSLSPISALKRCNENLTTGQFCKVNEEYPNFPFVIQPRSDVLGISDIYDDLEGIA